MNRRGFLAVLGLGASAALAPRRVYSFLWDQPLVKPFGPEHVRSAIKLLRAREVASLSQLAYLPTIQFVFDGLFARDVQ